MPQDFRVSETATFDEKMVAAGNAAVGMWVRAGAWSMHQLTDGFIPTTIARQIGTKTNANRLVNAGLWLEVRGGYQFPKWDEYQRSKEQVVSEKAAARERMKRIRSGERAPNVQSTNTERTGERSDVVRDSRPFPSLPVPSLVELGGEGYVSSGTRESSPPRGNLNANNPRCPEHISIPATDRGPNCRACGAVREWCENEPERRRERMRSANRTQQATIAACGLCDQSGWVLGDDRLPIDPARRCSHKAEATA